MIDPECRKATEKYICCCVRDAVVGRERKNDDTFEMSPIRIGEYILFYGKRRSTFPFHCLLGPDWALNGKLFFVSPSLEAYWVLFSLDLFLSPFIISRDTSRVYKFLSITSSNKTTNNENHPNLLTKVLVFALIIVIDGVVLVSRWCNSSQFDLFLMFIRSNHLDHYTIPVRCECIGVHSVNHWDFWGNNFVFIIY